MWVKMAAFADAAADKMNDSSKVRFLVVPALRQGQRLDNFLLRELKNLPRTRIYRLIRRGEVRINRGRCKPDSRLAAGDRIRIPPGAVGGPPPPAPPTEKLKRRLRGLVIFENQDLLILNKPAGLPAHGGSGIALGLIEALRQSHPDWLHAELAHRLDRDTSGCLIIAKQPAFLRHIQAAFRGAAVEKKYLALVHGAWPETLRRIELPLRKMRSGAGARVVGARATGKRAVTHFRIRERFWAATLLEATLETGRTHQIRVHCQSAGHAIIGDDRYRQDAGQSAEIHHGHLALHAWRIAFRPAPDAAVMRFEAPPDSRFTALLNGLRQMAEEG